MTPNAQLGAHVARRRRGFALIDVLVGTSLLVTSALGMTSVAVFTSQMRQLNDERALALRALDREAALLEAAAFDDLFAIHDGRGFELDAEDAEGSALRCQAGDADGFPGSIAVSVPDEVGDPNRLLDVTLRVDWVGSFGPQTMARTLRISRLGVGG